MSGYFFKVPESVIDDGTLSQMGPYAAVVWLVLARHERRKTGTAWPSVQRLMKLTGIGSTATLVKSIAKLESLGLIERTKACGRSNCYRLTTSRGETVQDATTSRGETVPLHEVKRTTSRGETVQDATTSRGETVPLHEVKRTTSRGETVPLHEVKTNENSQTKNSQTEGAVSSGKQKKKVNTPPGKPKKQASKKNVYDPLSAPLPFTSDAFREAWQLFVEYRTAIKKPLTPYATKLIIDDLTKWGERSAIASIEKAIKQSWTGVFETEPPPMTEDEIGAEMSRQILQIAKEQGFDHEG